MGDSARGEFERRCAVGDLAVGERRSVELAASGAECAAIAARLKVLRVAGVRAELELVRDPAGDVTLAGRLSAEISQACVITLEAVARRVDVPIRQRYSVRDGEVEADAEDPVEPIVGEAIEIGDVIVQNLALALDPYPRARGAAFEEIDDGAGKPGGPFAPLAGLRAGTEE